MYRTLIVLVLVVALSWATQLDNDDDSNKNDDLDNPEVIEENYLLTYHKFSFVYLLS